MKGERSFRLRYQSRRLSRLLLAGLLGLACHAHAGMPAATANAKPLSPHDRAKLVVLQTEAAFILKHDHTKAREGFLQAIRIDPRYAPAWFDVAVLDESDQDWAKASYYFKHYLSLRPTGPDAGRAQAQLALLAKYQDGSITPAMRRSATYDVAIQRARIFLADGYYREAILEASRAMSVDQNRWEAYAVVSLCMSKQGKRDESDKFRDMAIQRAPVDKQAQLKAVLSQGGSMVQSIAAPPVIRGENSASDDQSEGAYNAAFNALRQGNYAASAQAFRKFIQDHPNSILESNAWYWLGESCYASTDNQAALEAFAHLLSQYPRSDKAPDALLKIGYIQLQMNQVAAGTATLKSVIATYPDSKSANLAEERLRNFSVQ